MDAMECKEPIRCRTCPHFVRGACALEADLLVALEAVEGRRPRTATTPVALAWERQIVAA